MRVLAYSLDHSLRLIFIIPLPPAGLGWAVVKPGGLLLKESLGVLDPTLDL